MTKITELKIGPHYFKIKYKKRLFGDDGTGTIVNLLGDVDTGKQIIRVSRDAPEDLINYVILHEALHGIAALYGHHLEEHQILMLETGIGALLEDNPEFRESFNLNPPEQTLVVHDNVSGYVAWKNYP